MMTVTPTLNTAPTTGSNTLPASNGQHVSMWLTLTNSEGLLDPATELTLTESLFSDILTDIDNIDFGRVNRSSPNPPRLIVLLRASIVFRQRIRGWSELRNFLSFYLAKRGHDVNVEMKGLL